MLSLASARTARARRLYARRAACQPHFIDASAGLPSPCAVLNPDAARTARGALHFVACSGRGAGGLDTRAAAVDAAATLFCMPSAAPPALAVPAPARGDPGADRTAPRAGWRAGRRAHVAALLRRRRPVAPAARADCAARMSSRAAAHRRPRPRGVRLPGAGGGAGGRKPGGCRRPPRGESSGNLARRRRDLPVRLYPR